MEIAYNWVETSIYNKYVNVVMNSADCQYETAKDFKSAIRKFINQYALPLPLMFYADMQGVFQVRFYGETKYHVQTSVFCMCSRVNGATACPSKAEKAARFAWINNKPPAAELRKAFESNDTSNFFHGHNRTVEGKTGEQDYMNSGKKADTSEVR